MSHYSTTCPPLFDFQPHSSLSIPPKQYQLSNSTSTRRIVSGKWEQLLWQRFLISQPFIWLRICALVRSMARVTLIGGARSKRFESFVTNVAVQLKGVCSAWGWSGWRGTIPVHWIDSQLGPGFPNQVYLFVLPSCLCVSAANCTTVRYFQRPDSVLLRSSQSECLFGRYTPVIFGPIYLFVYSGSMKWFYFCRYKLEGNHLVRYAQILNGWGCTRV